MRGRRAIKDLPVSRSPISVTKLTCEYRTNPLGLDSRQPRLSWQLAGAGRNLRQSAYQILVASSLELLQQASGDCWDSGRIDSDRSVQIDYGGAPLASSCRYYWHVRIWDGDNHPSPWSEASWWEMGLLAPADWQAEWITPDLAEDLAVSSPAPLLRTTFTVDGDVRSARLAITSLGLYEAELNGQRVGDLLFTPGWTSYAHRLQYQVYDVTDLLLTGANAAGVTLGDGWYRGFLCWQGKRNLYGDKLGLLFQLRIDYTDGRSQLVTSGPDWKSSTGPILAADLYNGEQYDARLEKPGWSLATFVDDDWAGVAPLAASKEHLVALADAGVRRIEELPARSVTVSPEGETLIDFGQNLVGWVRIRVQGTAGDQLTLRYGEVLDQQGNLYVANLRTAQATDRYILRGGDAEVYEPRFTFHGFRYAGVTGYPGGLAPEQIVAVVVHSDMPVTGDFECSHPLLNQLQHNIRWGQKGNFLDVPTDCPQRDERLGWTADLQVFLRTAIFNMDVAGVITKWLHDLAADQHADGNVPVVIPDPLGMAGSSAWGDAATIVPWTLYQCYDDTRILEQQYTSMKGWVDWIHGQTGDALIWNTGFHFGDWLAIEAPDPRWPNPVTENDLLCTAFFAHSTDLLQRTAQVLGNTADAERYGSLLADIKAAFCHEFVSPAGRLSGNAQTAYVLALHFDLLPEGERTAAAARLAGEIRRYNNHLTTGFVGTPYLCHVLSRYGYLDLAYTLLEQESYPSWLYAVKLGATTMWERWDSLRPDGTFQTTEMNSFNHYAYGAIGDWLYRVVAGIELDPAAPGYKRIRIEPRPGGSLTWARARYESGYGAIESAWTLTDGHLELAVTIPPNTEATITLPAGLVTEGSRPVAQADGVLGVEVMGDRQQITVGSGEYRFRV
jgi:alpha-L-rhamnosidase